MSNQNITQTIRTALEKNPTRVQQLVFQDQTFWLKRCEHLSGLRLWQKGDPAVAFEAERQALHQLRDLGAPVPEILAEGDDFIALSDSGQPLNTVLQNPEIPLETRLGIFEQAALSLAGLHALGVSHGRPSLKDICWDGQRITWIDFERFAPRRNTRQGHAMDLVMFVLNGFAMGQGPSPEMTRAIETYRAADPAEIWPLAQAWCARNRWLGWLTKPMQLRRQGKAKEFKAIPHTLAAFSTP